MSIGLKEADEVKCWFDTLAETNYLSQEWYKILMQTVSESSKYSRPY